MHTINKINGNRHINLLAFDQDEKSRIWIDRFPTEIHWIKVLIGLMLLAAIAYVYYKKELIKKGD